MQAQTHAQSITTQQTAMAAAIKAASDKEAAKNTPTASNVTPIDKNDVVNIVPRLSIMGEKLVFLPNTVNYENNTISFWDGKKGSKVQVAPLELYKVSKPVDDREAAAKMGETFGKEFGHKFVHSRQRLVKINSISRNDAGQADKVDIEDFKSRLKLAILKAIDEM